MFLHFPFIFSDNGRCPVDGEEIDSDEIFADKAKTREIMILDCYCMYKEEGCTWTGKVINVEVRFANGSRSVFTVSNVFLVLKYH